MTENKNIEKSISQLFELVGITDPFELSVEEDVIKVVLATEDSGIVIGHHGDTLDSLQLVLAQVISKKTGEYKRVSLEVGDYKKNREDYLLSLAQQTKERALSESREVLLPNLKPWERRVVHMFLQEDEEVVSESVGEGRDRTLVVRPK